MRSTRLSEAQKKRLIVALTAGPWRKDMPTDLSPPARVSELIDTISSEQYLSRGLMRE
jgi:hypothetical protein